MVVITITNEYKSFFKTVTGAEGQKCYYPTRLDTYGKGCFYNCSYCYARQLLNFRNLWHPDDVGVADIEKIKKTISRKLNAGDVVRLGGMTDCFQPAERLHEVTLQTINELNKHRIHYLIVTKSNLIISPKYMSAIDPTLAHIQVSIPSTDNGVLDATDNAPCFEERVEVIETLYNDGYDVSLRLSPFLFETCDFDDINSIEVDKCLVEFLRIKPSMKEEMEDFITFDNYTHKEGGYRHLDLNKKLDVLSNLKFPELTVCDDVDEHYNFFRKYINHNPNDCCNLRL